jgi:hypothetical protein
MITSSGRIASFARRAVLAVAVATVIAIGQIPADALTPVPLPFKAMETARIANENTRHQSVLKEIALERQMTDEKMADQLKICTTAKCKAAQRADNARSQSQLDVEEEHENAAHAAKIAQIEAALAAAAKAYPTMPP